MNCRLLAGIGREEMGLIERLVGATFIVELDPADERKRFGLIPVLDALRMLRWFLIPTGIAGGLAVLSHAGKGESLDWSLWSYRGQAGVFYLALVSIAAALFMLFAVLTLRLDQCKDSWNEIDSIDRNKLAEQEVPFIQEFVPIATTALSKYAVLISASANYSQVVSATATWANVLQGMNQAMNEVLK